MRVAGGQIEGRLYVTARGDTAPALEGVPRRRRARRRARLRERHRQDVHGSAGRLRLAHRPRACRARASHEIATVDMDGGAHVRRSRRWARTACCRRSRRAAARSPSRRTCATTRTSTSFRRAAGARAACRSRRASTRARRGRPTGTRSRSRCPTRATPRSTASAPTAPQQARLTSNPAIDSSPSLLARRLARSRSSRTAAGSPQIYIMSAGGGGAKRVTFQGKYNQTPRWSPRADKPQIAFTGRDERGVFDVFILDVKSGQDRSPHAGQGLEPRPDVVARRAPHRVRLEPRRPLRPEPRDAPRGADLARQRLVPVLGTGAAPLSGACPPGRSRRSTSARTRRCCSSRASTTSGAVTVLENARRDHAARARHRRTQGAGALGAEGIARTLDVLRGYAALAREHGARIAAIGTEALRRAPNGGDFLGPAAEILGAPVEVIDGAREAALTLPRDGRVLPRRAGRARSSSSTSAAARRRSSSPSAAA